MCASNLSSDQKEDHVKRIADFALDAIHLVEQIPIDEDDKSKGNVSIRVGIHSGPVVSNIVGNLNPRFGLFGDSVVTSHTMETLGAADQVQCTDMSAALLEQQAPELEVTLRGTVEVKGKGSMTTHWVSRWD